VRLPPWGDLGGPEHDKRAFVVVRETNDLFQAGVDFLVAKNQLSTSLPLTICADFVQESDLTRAKDTVTFGSLISLIANDLYLYPLVFLVLLLLIEQSERNGIKAREPSSRKPAVQASSFWRPIANEAGSVLINAVGFTHFPWGTLHLDEKSLSRTVGSHELRHTHFNG
jgi:hypothetical protein